MNDMQRAVVVLSLIDALRQKGSWCGETHVQKSTYFLQELAGVPLGYEFILYKHGPYSFDLNDEMTSWQADLLLALRSRPPYGPSIVAGEGSSAVLQRHPLTRAQYAPQVQFVAERLAKRNVAELERVATAYFVTRNEPSFEDAALRAQRITELKPHVTYPEALAAVEEVDRIVKDASASITVAS